MPHSIWAQGTKAKVLNNILFRYDAETDANCRVLTLEGTFDLTLNCQNLTVNIDFPIDFYGFWGYIVHNKKHGVPQNFINNWLYIKHISKS